MDGIWKEIIATLLMLSPAIATKILDFLKNFQAGPFKALHFPGIRGKVAKIALNVVLSAVIALIAQYVGEKVGIDRPTVKAGVGVGVGSAVAYHAARNKMPHYNI